MMERLSERVGPTGSLQGEGLANLLGRPPFDPLTLALREAGQNIWDARDRGGETKSLRIPRMLVRIRHLTDIQSKFLKDILSNGGESDDEPSTTNLLHKYLAQEKNIPVLEICDFRTGGLSGPVDPQFSLGNFVRFFFDIGTAHFDGGDGGTYGYGRSSLYLAGASRTILVDTLLPGPKGARRFMGSRIGDSYQRDVDGRNRRYTGRHFWGRVEGEGVLPVEGPAAEKIALTLGMPMRGELDTGTTILIPWPQMEEINAGQRVADILLHNLWPKLVSSTGARAMEIAVEEHGISVPIQDPKKHPKYGLLSQALLNARTRSIEFGAKPLTVLRSSNVTGHISFAQTAQTHQINIKDDRERNPERLFESTIRHVALMRQSELVVKYLEFSGIADSNNWAGVFLCSEDEEVTRAFASSEPPAHDDWVPDRLSGRSATLVRVTKNKRIPEAVREYFGSDSGIHEDANGSTASLAGASDRFANQFLAGDGSGVGDTERGSNSSGGGGGRRPTLRTLFFLGLSYFEGSKLASFRTSLIAENPMRVQGSVDIDGVDHVELLPDDFKLPSVRGWRHEDGSYIKGPTCLFQPGENYVMEVEFRGVYSIFANCYLIRT